MEALDANAAGKRAFAKRLADGPDEAARERWDRFALVAPSRIDVPASADGLTPEDCWALLVDLGLAAGDPLSEAQVEAENGFAFVRKIRFHFAVDVVATQLALIRTLRGLTPVFGVLDDAEFDERRIERRYAENRDWAFGECWYWIRKLQARFFAGDYAIALDSASRAEPLLWTSLSQFETAEYHFYAGLSHAASCDVAAPGERHPGGVELARELDAHPDGGKEPPA